MKGVPPFVIAGYLMDNQSGNGSFEGGIGLYNTYVHIDQRGKKFYWVDDNAIKLKKNYEDYDADSGEGGIEPDPGGGDEPGPDPGGHGSGDDMTGKEIKDALEEYFGTLEDVPDWAYDGDEWPEAVNLGIIKGGIDGKFYANNYISRVQAAIMAYRAYAAAIANAGEITVDSEDISNAIDDWMEAHPGASTVIENNSVTIDKMVTGTLNYVTPELYGAIGDGTTNDTQAFNSACNSGLPIELKSNATYLIDSITVESQLIIRGNGATIKTTYGNSSANLFTLNTSVKKAHFENINFITTVGVTNENNIPNRSKKTTIAGYALNNLSIKNCIFENFDKAIVGLQTNGDHNLNNVLDTLDIEDCKIVNALTGISGIYRHVNIEKCNITLDNNSGNNDHCISLMADKLQEAIIEATKCDLNNSKSKSCMYFYTEILLNGAVVSVFKINNCIFVGDGYINNANNGDCVISACVMKAPNYNTTNKYKQFECSFTYGGKLTINDSDIQLESQSADDQNLIFNNCNIYSSGLISNERFRLFKVYDSRLKNIGIVAMNDGEIINCTFTSPDSLANSHYVSVSSNSSSSLILNCIFKISTNASKIAGNVNGYCTLVSVISSLPNGVDNSESFSFINKIEV